MSWRRLDPEPARRPSEKNESCSSSVVTFVSFETPKTNYFFCDITRAALVGERVRLANIAASGWIGG
jgi:hypothetical protein